MLYLMEKKNIWKNIGLYRDDELAVFKNASGSASEKMRKTQLQYLLKQKDLQIIYLDVAFNLNDGSCRPYRKPTDATHYIHIQSDHPLPILNQLPWSIEKRLSQLSSSKRYEKKWHHIMSNVSPAVRITKN